MSTLAAGNVVAQGALVEELPGELSAWEACRLFADWPRLLFLESAQVSPLGRYSFLAADPYAWLCSRRDEVYLGERKMAQTDPFLALADLLPEPLPTLPGLPPFQGGAAGLFGFDLCHHLEKLPRPAFDDFQTPDLVVGLYDWVVSFDHWQKRAWIVSTGMPEKDPRRRQRRARARLHQVRAQLAEPAPHLGWEASPALRPRAPHYPVPGLDGVYSSFSRDAYLRTIRRAIDYVHAGDCFQVNIAQRLLATPRVHPLELYGHLRERNAAPFAGYLDLGDFTIVSASPERFLRLENGIVETRPIKGTRPRGRTPDEDQAAMRELESSAKDRAENVMIVDLLRNDLGRVCEFGSVRVEALCRLETFAFVHHLVSEVRGKLRPGRGGIDLLRAAFPGGSVTGAPKIRAMEIISELERTARGPYCGSLGYLGFNGSMDTNLLIRTFTQGKGWLQFPVGGGIVADSQPDKEYDETWHKAAGLLKALGS